ncbi:hypothetical protein F5887DRAFT_925399 [Amanita rubescens]|nr:hypothetical protein F5887DRAFT_925399 [Amanita rubescens]
MPSNQMGVRDAIEAGLAKVGKWYKDIRKNDMVFVCLALDPSIKLKYCKSKWNDNDFEEGMQLLNKVFDRYAVQSLRSKANASAAPDSEKASQQVPVKRRGYGASFLQATIQKRAAVESVNQDPRQELREYLAAPLDDGTEDVVKKFTFLFSVRTGTELEPNWKNRFSLFGPGSGSVLDAWQRFRFWFWPRG